MSMRSAIYVAMDVFKDRKRFKEITANPLAFSPREKKRPGSDIE
jgi:hypothetical protein